MARVWHDGYLKASTKKVGCITFIVALAVGLAIAAFG